jgi:hypothetical protein
MTARRAAEALRLPDARQLYVGCDYAERHTLATA